VLEDDQPIVVRLPPFVRPPLVPRIVEDRARTVPNELHQQRGTAKRRIYKRRRHREEKREKREREKSGLRVKKKDTDEFHISVYRLHFNDSLQFKASLACT
jgi:hypothetical protein